MLYYLLGIVSGALFTGLLFVFVLLFKTPLERTLSQVQSRLKPKGAIIEPDNPELDSWINELKEE